MSDCDPPDASCPHVLMHRTTMMIHSRSPSWLSHCRLCFSCSRNDLCLHPARKERKEDDEGGIAVDS